MPPGAREELADALQRVKDASSKGVVQSSAVSRSDRELLIQKGYLRDIIKGWYFLTRPTDEAGQSTAWYSIYWDFLSVYLPTRFDNDYCLSALSSLDIHVGSNVIPRQVTVIAGKGGKTVLDLPHNTSLLAYEDAKNLPSAAETVDGLRVMPLAMAICRAPQTFFQQRPSDAQIALRAVKSTSDLTRVLLESRLLGVAERLAGAYDFLGDKARAEEIVAAMKAAGVSCESQNPFEKKTPVYLSYARPVSPYAARIEALYELMRGEVLGIFSKCATHTPVDTEEYLRHVDEVYENDAYNSLSIEGYQVTPELIRRIREGLWDPDNNPQDTRDANALAARGYLEAFRMVKDGIRDILGGQPAPGVVVRDYPKWYRALFSESVKAGIMEAASLAGFRNDRVFIKGSRHVPPPRYAVPDAVASFLSLLNDEQEASVRAVLGHFLFVFIHPYMDGNGRMARFLMNAMMASGGLPWTIIRMSRRREYMAALEQASVEQKIAPFARFVLGEMKVDWTKAPKRERRR